MGKQIQMTKVSGNHFTVFAGLSVVKVRVNTIHQVNCVRIS